MAFKWIRRALGFRTDLLDMDKTAMEIDFLKRQREARALRVRLAADGDSRVEEIQHTIANSLRRSGAGVMRFKRIEWRLGMLAVLLFLLVLLVRVFTG